MLWLKQQSATQHLDFSRFPLWFWLFFSVCARHILTWRFVVQAAVQREAGAGVSPGVVWELQRGPQTGTVKLRIKSVKNTVRINLLRLFLSNVTNLELIPYLCRLPATCVQTCRPNRARLWATSSARTSRNSSARPWARSSAGTCRGRSARRCPGSSARRWAGFNFGEISFLFCSGSETAMRGGPAAVPAGSKTAIRRIGTLPV